MKRHETPRVREPAVSGLFYPGDEDALARGVDAYLAEVPAAETRVCPKALIVPHAGFVYSGPIAASAFARLRPFAGVVRRVVLVAPAHRAFVDGLAAPGVDALRTPLGDVRVATEVLATLPNVHDDARAHAREHALEVELPFLQRVVPDAEIVPLAVGRATPEEVAETLGAAYGGPETVLVVSSDMSHYLPYAEGRAVDAVTAAKILELGADLTSDEACGAAGINGLLVLARRHGLRGELIDLRSSGDTAGSRDEVVGYGAFAFYEDGGHA
jgi:AmmeMemoRadiSam system protein B